MAYHHILIAVDLTPQSQILVNKAVALARPFQADISLIHVNLNYNLFYTGMTEANLGYTYEDVTRETHEALNKMADSAGYPVRKVLNGRGDLSRNLSHMIEKYHIDLVVCGHHQDFWSKLISSARPLLNTVHVDMLIVPFRDYDDEKG